MTCPLCEAMCGLQLRVDDDLVTDIRGNRDDVWSQGHLCPKGTSLPQLHTDPDRLRAPMVRTRDGGHVAVSWDDAYAEVERVLRPVIDRHGASAVTVYVGNPVAHNLGLSTHIGALIGMAQVAGMSAYYSPGTVDQWPLNLVSALLFGGMWNAPIPDVDRTDHLMILGANPSASQGSMLSAPDLMGRLAAHPRARRDRHRHRPAPHPDRAARDAVGADQAGHRRAAAVRDPVHPRRAELGATARPPRRPRHGSRRGHRDGRGLRPGDRRRTPAASTRPRSANSHTTSRTPRAPSCTAASVPARRSSAPWRPGWCSSSTRRSDRWTVPAARCSRSRPSGRRCS